MCVYVCVCSVCVYKQNSEIQNRNGQNTARYEIRIDPIQERKKEKKERPNHFLHK